MDAAELQGEPTVAGEVYRDAISTAREYASHLSTTGVEWGLIGPREVPRLWDRHILNCAVVADLVDADDTVVDVGSGAGLPGIAMAIRRPDTAFTLVEPLARRVQWLEMVVADLGLHNVEVVRARSEELAGTRRFSVATARAVAALSGLVPWTLPLLGPRGRLLAIKGQAAEEEIRKAGQALRSFGASEKKIVTVGAGLLEVPTRVVEVIVGQNGGKVPGSLRKG
ncbi:16S rRNA (guanine(527)-N(7))-methyltransferase RsmG [Saxibacter everestensis]|uniref:Ribosomal RNA small subunit methyltransferase G n=1 Tax=Saxibacter everestensis TaxID=2909229 RepID=A0ABY8QU72_9MICO|nr:16S rRNA (guanine(527)-N(7))-methyltransferase RsmG [Brevibacteriaceae bacterium ZFBP1038]